MLGDPKEEMRRFLYERHCASVEQMAKALEKDLPRLVPGIKAEDYIRLLSAVREQTGVVPEHEPNRRWGMP